MSQVRRSIMLLTNDDLWDIFDEMDNFEINGVVGENAKLRTLAKELLHRDTVQTMSIIAHEVWRELAGRGQNYTADKINY